MARPTAASRVRKTPPFDFLFGRYSHSGTPIPYFQVSMSFKDAGEYLKLINEMPGSTSLDWRVEELFQRDIDWHRVDKKIVPYLKKQNQPQFFNSLTIALLPIRKGKLDSYAIPGKWHPPSLDDEKETFKGGKIERFGPVTCGYWNDWASPEDEGAKLGQLSWNTDEVCGVAIDGQHRLAAIKQLVQDASGGLQESSVPVIFIVLDEKLGFTKNATRDDILITLRSLFIDLNKHAEKVKRSRQILLDDREPTSICVRELIGGNLTNGQNELTATPPKIPLSLIDWHSDGGLFGDGPYLSTILGIDYIVRRLLGVQPFDDPMEFDTLQKKCVKIENRLKIDLSEARERLAECKKYSHPFEFLVSDDTSEIRVIADGFGARWSEPVVKLLTELQPYADLLRTRDSNNTMSPEFANWHALKVAADRTGQISRATGDLQRLEKELENRENPISTSDYRDALDEIDALKKGNELAFTVVFQRALALAFERFRLIDDSLISELTGNDYEIDFCVTDVDEEEEQISAVSTEVQRAEELIKSLNMLICNSEFLLKHFEYAVDASYERFWVGSFVQPEGRIDFTQAASERASNFLLLAGYFYIYQTEGKYDAFDDVWDLVDSPVTNLDSKYGQSVKRLAKSVATIILDSRSDEEELPEDEAELEELKLEQIRRRAEWIWNKLSAQIN